VKHALPVLVPIYRVHGRRGCLPVPEGWAIGISLVCRDGRKLYLEYAVTNSIHLVNAREGQLMSAQPAGRWPTDNGTSYAHGLRQSDGDVLALVSGLSESCEEPTATRRVASPNEWRLVRCVRVASQSEPRSRPVTSEESATDFHCTRAVLKFAAAVGF
jgi:hypothetical protein